MPDLTYHTARWCQSNEMIHETVEGSKGETYVVTWSSKHPEWSCTCMAFKFSGGKTCKHIRKVDREACRYGEMAACGDPVPDDSWERGSNKGFGREYICPRCAGQTRVMRFAA